MKEQLTAGFPCLQHCPGSGTKLCVLTFAWLCCVTKAQACWQDVYVEGRAPGRALIRECVEPEVPFLAPARAAEWWPSPLGPRHKCFDVSGAPAPPRHSASSRRVRRDSYERGPIQNFIVTLFVHLL